MQVVQISCPFGIKWKRCALLQNEPLELLDVKLSNKKFNTGTVAILLFTETGKDARDSLRQWKKLLFRDKLVEQLSLVRNCSQSAADIQLKATLLHSIFCACDCNRAHIV